MNCFAGRKNWVTITVRLRHTNWLAKWIFSFMLMISFLPVAADAAVGKKLALASECPIHKLNELKIIGRKWSLFEGSGRKLEHAAVRAGTTITVSVPTLRLSWATGISVFSFVFLLASCLDRFGLCAFFLLLLFLLSILWRMTQRVRWMNARRCALIVWRTFASGCDCKWKLIQWASACWEFPCLLLTINKLDEHFGVRWWRAKVSINKPQTYNGIVGVIEWTAQCVRIVTCADQMVFVWWRFHCLVAWRWSPGERIECTMGGWMTSFTEHVRGNMSSFQLEIES